MEHIFLSEEGNMHYLECLTEAHDQMLYRIQDPLNCYDIMNNNPLESTEAMHGVPKEFGDMLIEITKYQNEDPEDVMSVDLEDKKDSFIELDDAGSQ